jgi:hypothetical protein
MTITIPPSMLWREAMNLHFSIRRFLDRYIYIFCSLLCVYYNKLWCHHRALSSDLWEFHTQMVIKWSSLTHTLSFLSAETTSYFISALHLHILPCMYLSRSHRISPCVCESSFDLSSRSILPDKPKERLTLVRLRDVSLQRLAFFHTSRFDFLWQVLKAILIESTPFSQDTLRYTYLHFFWAVNIHIFTSWATFCTSTGYGSSLLGMLSHPLPRLVQYVLPTSFEMEPMTYSSMYKTDPMKWFDEHPYLQAFASSSNHFDLPNYGYIYIPINESSDPSVWQAWRMVQIGCWATATTMECCLEARHTCCMWDWDKYSANAPHCAPDTHWRCLVLFPSRSYLVDPRHPQIKTSPLPDS